MLGVTKESKISLSAGVTIAICAIIACLIACAVSFATPEKAYASNTVYGFSTISCTTNSISLTWEQKYSNVKSYEVEWLDATGDINDDSKYQKKALSSTTFSYNITGLKPGTLYAIWLVCTLNTGESAKIAGAAYSTRVVKPTGVKQTKWSYKNNRAYFTWDVQTGASQVQCKLINVANGKAVLDRTFSSLARDFYVWGMRTDMMFAVQMRVKDANGWSPWSNKMYFLSQPLTTYKTKVAGGKLAVAWKKVMGAQKYTIYVSTKAKSGYKKVATVRSTKSSVVIKKLQGKKFNSKKTYYVYVQATKKVGGKTFTSGKHYAYKVRGGSGTMKYPF